MSLVMQENLVGMAGDATVRRLVTTGMNVNLLPELTVGEVFAWVVAAPGKNSQTYLAYYDGVSVWAGGAMQNRGNK